MLLVTDLQGLGNLEGDERVVGLATSQARLADDCQGQQRVVLCCLLCNVSWRQHHWKSAQHMYILAEMNFVCMSGNTPSLVAFGHSCACQLLRPGVSTYVKPECGPSVMIDTLLCKHSCAVRTKAQSCNNCNSHIDVMHPTHLEADSWSSICRFCRLSCMRWKVPSGPMPMAMLKLSPWMVTTISSSGRWSTQLMSRLPKLTETYRALPLLSPSDARLSTASSPFGPFLPTTAKQKASKSIHK